MSDLIIETQIDKFIELLTKRRKIALSDAARILNIKESQLEMWIGTLEDSGVVELKYPVLGEPEIVLKGILPENLKLEPPKKIEEKVEVKPEIKTEAKPEVRKPEYQEVGPSYERIETQEKQIKGLEERIVDLEKRILEEEQEVNITKLKEELFESLIIISSLTDIEKISYYLSFIERIVIVLKAKKSWDNVDKDLLLLTIKSIAENWIGYKKADIAKIFEEMAKKIETI